MKSKKRMLALAMVLALTVSALAGCSKDAGSGKDTVKTEDDSKGTTKKDDTTSDEVVTLTVVNWESDTMNAAMQSAFDNVFSVEHPNIKVEIVPSTYSDYGTELATSIIAGDAPDIFQAGHDMAMSFHTRGLTTDWTTYAEADTEFTAGFYPGSYDLWKYDGKVVGLPSLVNVYGIFYNKDILAAAGLEEPKAGWTYEDLFAYGEKLKDPASNKYGIYGMDVSAFGISLMSVSNGGTPFVNNIAQPTAVTVDDEFTKAVDRVASLIADGTLYETTYDTSSNQSMFEAGEIGLLWYGQWIVDNLTRNVPDLNWGYAPNPVGTSGEQATIFDPVGWCSPTDLEHESEVWELMKFISSDVYTDVLAATPVASSAYEAPSQVFFDIITEAGHAEAAESVKTMMNAKNKVAVRYLAAWASDASKQWDEDFTDILNGKNGKTSALLAEMAERVNNVIKSN